MSRYSLAPRAQRDIGAIWDYTAKRWDVEQADRYVLELRHIIEMVADDPRKRRACDDIRLGYWKYPELPHDLFFVSPVMASKSCASYTRAWITRVTSKPPTPHTTSS